MRLLKAAVLAAAALVLAACAHNAQPKLPPVHITLMFQNAPEPVVIELNDQSAPFQPYLRQQINAGFYGGLPVHRLVPQALVMVGEGTWRGRQNQPLTLKFVQNPKFKTVGRGQFGLQLNPDGTYGPVFVLGLAGPLDPAGGYWPASVRLGKVVSGAAVLHALRKGDNLLSATIR